MITIERVAEVFGFTPGPWEKDYGGTIGHIKQTTGRTDGNTPTIAKYDTMMRYEWKEYQLIPDKKIEANGKLIAASPQMLHALVKQELSHSKCNAESEEIINIIESADRQKRLWPELRVALEGVENV